MKLIDAHAHLDFEQFDEDREQVIANCKQELTGVIVSGSNADHNQATLDLTKRHPNFLFPCLGLHPIHEQQDLSTIQSQIKQNKQTLVAVGEIGLDYHHAREEETRQAQEKNFKRMLELAGELGKPVVIHARDAEKRALELLDSYEAPQVMLHCFNGRLELAEEGVDRGYFIGITTQVLYSSRVKQLARELPAESLLLETDSPFLAEGQRNVPNNIKKSLKTIVELKRGKESLDGERLAEIIFDNTLTMFPDLDL